jgi:O-methyltransferase
VNGFVSVRDGTVRALRAITFLRLYNKYREFTMASATNFWRNLLIVDQRRHVKGCIVECGVWRGGMIAGIAEVLGPDREYFLFDSFDGLPPAKAMDGKKAIAWQKDSQSPTYYDNCRAPMEYAERAMMLSSAPKNKIVKGWFCDTLPTFVPPCPIAVLRLDGDWYDSTLIALETLFGYLAQDGIVIIDDYYAWDGCSRAVHDFLSQNQLTARLMQKYGVCVLEPRPAEMACQVLSSDFNAGKHNLQS